MIKLAFRTCLLLFLCFTMMGIKLVQAQVTVGVSPGDMFEYNMYSVWSSDFSNTPPAELVELNRTEWVRVTVTEISGSKINVHVTTHYRNGTEAEVDGFSDIDTGETTPSEVPPFISANLDSFDAINPSAPDPYYVNATLVRDYANSQRETNLLRFEETSVSSEVGEYTRNSDYYFDKNTGVLVEYLFEFSYTGLSSMRYVKLVSSNVWVIPEFPVWIILPLFMIVALSAIAIKRKVFKPTYHNSRCQ